MGGAPSVSSTSTMPGRDGRLGGFEGVVSWIKGALSRRCSEREFSVFPVVEYIVESAWASFLLIIFSISSSPQLLSRGQLILSQPSILGLGVKPDGMYSS